MMSKNTEIYLVKIGNSYLNYQFICDTISLLHLNKNPILSKYPTLTNTDFELIKNLGGTILYKEHNEIFVWLININHDKNSYTSELQNKIESIKESVKRDIKLNEILNN